MKPLAWIGIVLIVLGVAGLVVENVSFTERKTVLDVGPLKVQADEQKVVPIPTIAGIAAIVVGLGLVFMSRPRSGKTTARA
jgi:drug/metabolite transporter (DMT)-like permease